MIDLDSTSDPRSRMFAARVLTGDRPTGQLHLGHLFGTLLNRVRLQAEGVDLMALVADYQTSIDRDSPGWLPEDVDELVADYLAVGHRPDTCDDLRPFRSCPSFGCCCRF
jgi:tryptophanyl-tRNA synthetase